MAIQQFLLMNWAPFICFDLCVPLSYDNFSFLLYVDGGARVLLL